MHGMSTAGTRALLRLLTIRHSELGAVIKS